MDRRSVYGLCAKVASSLPFGHLRQLPSNPLDIFEKMTLKIELEDEGGQMNENWPSWGVRLGHLRQHTHGRPHIQPPSNPDLVTTIFRLSRARRRVLLAIP